MFSIDKNIAVASTPPREFYVNPVVFDALKEVFASGWQFAGDTIQVARPLVAPFQLFAKLLGCPPFA